MLGWRLISGAEFARFARDYDRTEDAWLCAEPSMDGTLNSRECWSQPRDCVEHRALRDHGHAGNRIEARKHSPAFDREAQEHTEHLAVVLAYGQGIFVQYSALCYPRRQ